ncbi:HAMP domain-containing sensor histidine kinase [Kitasatospora camelliae]|uniref:histidine kinase n=1 Tax=Kitasatospora camelliae TaxID=3156397 RepID=A0AAU8K3X3_9ACTN
MRRRVGLRGRIAATILLALLVPGLLLSVVSYRVLRDSAEHDFRARALSSTLSDLTSAINSVREGNKRTALANAREALAVRKFNTFAVYLLKPTADGAGYTLADPPPFERPDPAVDPSEWLASREATAVIAGNVGVQLDFADPTGFTATEYPLSLMDEKHLKVIRSPDGEALVIGGEVGRQGPGDPYPGAPVVALEYHGLGPVEDEAAAHLRGLLLVDAATVAIGALLAWWIAGRVQRPVRAAGAAARALGEGDLTVRLPVTGRDELADLSTSFNLMAARLSDTIDELTRHEERQRRFVADVSHELRTPTASLLAAAAALDNPATRDGAAVLIAPQLRRLAALTEDLLEISRLDAGEAVLLPQPIDLADLVADVAAHCEDPAAVSVRAEGDTGAEVDPRRIHTVVGNLVSNALRHGSAPVEVTVSGTADTVAVRVADHGPGVPADLRERVFDRFVRGDRARATAVGDRSRAATARDRGGSGNGLGLAIALENARLHRATLTVSDGPRAVFTLTVPRRPPEG